VQSTLEQISSCGSDFNNMCIVMSSLLATACTYIWMLARISDDVCFYLLVSVVESWVLSMAQRFPRTAAGLPNAQIEFEREKEVKLRSFIDSFMEEYPSTGIPPDKFSTISIGRLGTFLHLALFQAWFDAIRINEKLPIKFLDDCLVGRYALPVIYYVTGWTFFSTSKPKALTIAVDKRQMFSCFGD
jgi:hypothetical protein